MLRRLCQLCRHQPEHARKIYTSAALQYNVTVLLRIDYTLRRLKTDRNKSIKEVNNGK